MPLLLRYDGSASSVHAAAMPGWLTIQNHRSLTRCRRHIPSLRKSIRHCKKTLPAPSAMITSSGYCRISFFPRADWRPAEAMFRSDSGVFAGSCALLEGWGRSSFPPCFFFALLFAGVSKRRPLFFPRPLAARQTANAKLSRQSSHAKALPLGTAMHCDSLQRALYSKGGCFFRKEPDVYPSSGSLAIFMPKAYR